MWCLPRRSGFRHQFVDLMFQVGGCSALFWLTAKPDIAAVVALLQRQLPLGSRSAVTSANEAGTHTDCVPNPVGLFTLSLKLAPFFFIHLLGFEEIKSTVWRTVYSSSSFLVLLCKHGASAYETGVFASLALTWVCYGVLTGHQAAVLQRSFSDWAYSF